MKTRTWTCARGHEPVWWDHDDPCFHCGQPGTDTDAPELKPARSWVNPADYTAEADQGDGL